VKVLTLYNDYRSRSNGELRVVLDTQELLAAAGVRTRLVQRSSREVDGHLRKKVGAFFTGIYSLEAARGIARLLQEDRPDLVHVHNLYPLFSPSVLAACRRAGVPTVMSVHNFGLTCPSWDHFRRGQVCRKCVDGSELWCVIHNCRGDLAASAAYAARSMVARRLGLFRRNVTLFVALSQSGKRWLTETGFDGDRITVLPNAVAVPGAATDPAAGRYVAFAGRWTTNKGFDTLLAAASRVPDIPFSLAGESLDDPPLAIAGGGNVRLLGLLDAFQMTGFYCGARVLVMPSRGFEMCPRVVLEAMAHGVPVIASRQDALAELVEDGVTGLLFTSGDADDLAGKIRRIWEAPALAGSLGMAARAAVLGNHDRRDYAVKLLAIYERALELPPPG
jgi:glycosyltransferase involved in cell wall biosynthesis